MENYDSRRDLHYTENSVRSLNQHLNQTRSQRVRAALFPETVEESHTTDYTTSAQFKQIFNDKPTAVQRLSAPSQLLKTAVLNLINYQDDADATVKAIPELLKLLNDDDRTVCVHAINIIEQLAKKDASRHALASSQNLINSLVNLLNSSNDIEVQRVAASALYNISCNQNGLSILFKCGGIPALVKLLGSPNDNVVRYALSTLHNLLLYEDSAKVAVLKCGGIPKFVALLASHNDVKVLAIVLDCLHILAFNNVDAKLMIGSCGAPKEIVRILRQTNYEKLLWTTIRLMKVLSICATNKPLLIKFGAIHELSEQLDKTLSPRIILSCLLTIRNLSDCVTKDEKLDVLIRKLIEYLNSNTDMNITICSIGILSNLTCNNDVNKTKFVDYNGIEALVRTIVQATENCDEIYEPAVCSLRHVTNRHAQAFKAQEAIRYNYGLPVIAQIIKSDTNRWPLLKATMGLIRNLALSENNIQSLRELGIIPRLVQLLTKAASFYQQNGGNNAIIDDVPIDEIIEAAVAALHQLLRDPNNRVIVYDLDCTQLLVRLLYIPFENIQKVACGCLCELTNEKVFLDLIQNENVIDRITELLHSKDEVLATYASAILFRLSENKTKKDGHHDSGVGMGAGGTDRIYTTIGGGGNQQYHNNQTANYLEMQQKHINENTDKMTTFKTNALPKNVQQQQQQPSAWFDTDL